MTRILLSLAYTCAGSWMLAGSLCGADPESKGTANEPIEQVMLREAAGQSIDRRSELQNLLDSDSKKSAFAHWQAGMVQRDGKWVKVEQLQDADLGAAQAAYLKKRGDAELNVEEHRQLARWCVEKRLFDEAHAHWNAVTETLPNDIEARQQLGHQWLDGAWYSPEQMKSAAAASKQLMADMKKWSGPVRKIVIGLASDKPTSEKEALQRLKAIQDESAIPALELAALQVEDDSANCIVSALAKFRSKSACMALTRIALAYPLKPRGELAMQEIKSYPREFYVPELLSLLGSDIETKISYEFNQRGELLMRRAMFRDTRDRREMIQLERLVRVNETQRQDVDSGALLFRHVDSDLITSTRRPTDAGLVNTDELAAAHSALEDQADLERRITEFNAKNQELSHDVYHVLARTTDQQQPEKSAQAWWDWWQKYNYRPKAAKPLSLRQYKQIDRPQLTVTSYNTSVRQVDCLVAGTQVQTSRGLRAIESLKVGDKVLSQNIETGELALKSVLRLVPRTATNVVSIKTESSEIQSTLGHRWWVSGKGWLMAGQLEERMVLHTATGSTKIMALSETAEQPTFNLVVDDFHTYFVGADRVLSFDNVDPRPSLRSIPGYGQLVSK